MAAVAPPLRTPIALAIGVVSALGLAAELVNAVWQTPAIDAVTERLSLSYEQNLPTWFSSCLLAGCAFVLAVIARDVGARRRRWRWHWAGLAAGFALMSLDETAELHEHLADVVRGGDLIYFNWVIPAAGVLVVLGAIYARFVWALPPVRRRQVIIAAAVYLGGAVGMELPLGWWTRYAGDDNLGYALIDWLEETLEMIGAGYFLWVVAVRWDERAEAEP